MSALQDCKVCRISGAVRGREGRAAPGHIVGAKEVHRWGLA